MLKETSMPSKTWHINDSIPRQLTGSNVALESMEDPHQFVPHLYINLYLIFTSEQAMRWL